MIEEIFARNLKKIRDHKNLSQEELAEKCGLDRTYIGIIRVGACHGMPLHNTPWYVM